MSVLGAASSLAHAHSQENPERLMCLLNAEMTVFCVLLVTPRTSLGSQFFHVRTEAYSAEPWDGNTKAGQAPHVVECCRCVLETACSCPPPIIRQSPAPQCDAVGR